MATWDSSVNEYLLIKSFKTMFMTALFLSSLSVDITKNSSSVLHLSFHLH